MAMLYIGKLADYKSFIRLVYEMYVFSNIFIGSSQNVVRHIPLLYKTFTVSNLKEALP